MPILSDLVTTSSKRRRDDLSVENPINLLVQKIYFSPKREAWPLCSLQRAEFVTYVVSIPPCKYILRVDALGETGRKVVTTGSEITESTGPCDTRA